MKTVHSPEFSKAMSRLTLDNVFFTALLYSLDPKPTDDVPTAGTNGVRVVYNPAFFKPLTKEDAVFVLTHEIAHVILFHPLRRGARDPELWNIACVDEASRISMADGSCKRAQDIVAGELLMTPFGVSPVLARKVSVKDEIMELCFIDGKTLHCTPDHRILTKRGYVHAEQLTEADEVCTLDSGNERLCPREREDEATEGHSCGYGTDGVPSIQPSGEPWAIEGSNSCKAHEPEVPAHLDARAVCVHGGVGGWRGDCVLCVFDQQKNREGLYAAASVCDKHIAGPDAVATGAGHVWCAAEEHQRQTLLALRGVWVSDSRSGSCYSTICKNPSTEIRHTAGTVRATTGTEAARFDDSCHAAVAGGVEGVEFTRLAIKRRLSEKRTVIDFTTTFQCFVAEGVVVHNCDYVANGMLEDHGMKTPAMGIQPDPAFKGLTTEQVYDILKQEADANGGKLPAGRPQLGEGLALVDVQDYDPNGEGNEGKTRAQAERDSGLATEKAMQAAKAAGQLSREQRDALQAAQVRQEPWHAHLRRYFNSMHSRQYNWARVNTRHAALHGTCAPEMRTEQMGKIVVSIDESGSLTNEMLCAIGAHLRDILKECNPSEVVVLRHTDEVGDVDTYAPPYDLTIERRMSGGTDFRPVFAKLWEDHSDAQVVLMFTDCEGPMGEDFPMDVLWITSTQEPRINFGEVIHADFND